VYRDARTVPPPPADCTAVVESPARKNAGGLDCFGAASADAKVAMVARSGSVAMETYILKLCSEYTVGDESTC
jgi:hypothetical protein